MATPTDKSPEIDQLLEDIFGIDRRSSIRANLCTWCGGEAEEFRDPLSEKEYMISGLCQQCQDKTFGG